VEADFVVVVPADGHEVAVHYRLSC
jgi:hypothetical protein